MNIRNRRSLLLRAIFAALFFCALGASEPRAEPLNVFATVPDLAILSREIGGDRVVAASMVASREDPHFAEAKPSFVKRLSEADVFLSVGFGLEIGYEDALLAGARNPGVMPGRPGNIVAASAVTPIDTGPTGVVTRALGDVHVGGNPHFLSDPLSALQVAALIAERFGEIRPAEKAHFDARLTEFRRRIGRALVGPELDDKYDGTKLAVLYRRGEMAAFLEAQGDSGRLSGWLGAMMPHYGTKAIDDHPMWPYFARTFGIEIVGHLEPRPGIQPTTKHLQSIIEQMRADKITLIIQAPYYNPRHARFVADQTGAHVAVLAHQGEVTEDYVTFVDGNVSKLIAAVASDNAGTQR